MNILTVSDNPISFSGVSQQIKLIIDNFSKNNKVISLSLDKTKPIQVSENWGIAYIGKSEKERQENILSTLREEKFDYVIFMTDPRQFIWVMPIEYELKKLCSNLVYYHVWDNKPNPNFNKGFYDIFDHIACISKLTFNCMREMGYKNISYVPHTLPVEFQKLENSVRFSNDFTILWDSRNQLRKSPSVAIEAFSMFHKKHPDSFLVMKTDPILAEGCDVQYLFNHYGLKPKTDCILIGDQLSLVDMNVIYNACDVVLNTSLAEGFGLSALAALKTGKLLIAPQIGGLQDQVDNNVGYAIKPDFTYKMSNIAAPFINYDFIKPETYVKFLEQAYYLSPEKKSKKNNCAIEKFNEKFSNESFNNNWNNIIKEQYEDRKLLFENFVNTEII